MANTSENTKVGAITVPIKPVKTRNFLIIAGVGIAVIGLIVLFNRKSKITQAVVTEI